MSTACSASVAAPRAELFTIGDEILSGDIVNTNAAFIGARCRAVGIELRRAVTVRDRVDEIVQALESAAGRADVILISGGLGPTTDDLTTDAVARMAGVALRRDTDALGRLEAKFRAFGRAMPAVNAKQADFPEGAEVLPNPIGTAEGFAMCVPGGAWIVVMPGVPRELRRMMLEQVEPRLRERFEVRVVPRRVYRILGMGESSVAERIAEVIEQGRRRSRGLEAMYVHYRASMPEVTVVLEATPDRDGTQATEEELGWFDEPLAQALHPALYGIGEAGFPPRLVRALQRAGLHVCTAESCTGGGVGRLIAGVPGASACFDGAIVAYDNRVKISLLGVPAALLAEHGAVSEPVARAMAEGARRALGSDLSVAITGIAGPSGGTPEKPVGTVDLAVSDANETRHLRLALRGERGNVQHAAELWALKLVWDRLRERNLATIEEMAG